MSRCVRGSVYQEASASPAPSKSESEANHGINMGYGQPQPPHHEDTPSRHPFSGPQYIILVPN
jgi:hypothetical protein